MFQNSGLEGPAQASQLAWESSLFGRQTCIGVLLPTPPSWLGSPKTKPAKNICVGGGKLTLPPLSSFLETVATVKYSKTEAEIERGEAPVGYQREPCPPHAHFCLLPSGSVMAWVAVAVAEGEERCSKGLESWHPAMRPAPIWLNPAIMPWGKRTKSTEGTCPRSHGQLGFSRILLALHESLRFCVTL